MFHALLAVALVSLSAEPPAPLPDRWLLKLAPAELPQLPDQFWKNNWWESYSPRSRDGQWEQWTTFAPGTDKKASEATIVRASSRRVSGRTMPLAVHGPLVDFDGTLYTVALTEKWARPLLFLGAAVEVQPNVWYQAYSEKFAGGEVRVTEIRAEFAADPRKVKNGKAKVQLFVRMLTDREGERTEFAGEYRPNESKKGREVLIWGKVNANASKTVSLELPHGVSPPTFEPHSLTQLIGTTSKAPNPTQSTPGPDLVQPPPVKQ
jgi:hypothetical protein